jgi:hypothetical protein
MRPMQAKTVFYHELENLINYFFINSLHCYLRL